MVAGTRAAIVEFAVALVAFGCARWGRPSTVLLSGLSIPAAAVVASSSCIAPGVFSARSARPVPVAGRDSAYRFSDRSRLGAAILRLLVLGVPVAGRARAAAARARRAAVPAAARTTRRGPARDRAAAEIARLREEQARLARDVHDVVGHSLAVILAQAESAQYLTTTTPRR